MNINVAYAVVVLRDFDTRVPTWNRSAFYVGICMQCYRASAFYRQPSGFGESIWTRLQLNLAAQCHIIPMPINPVNQMHGQCRKGHEHSHAFPVPAREMSLKHGKSSTARIHKPPPTHHLRDYLRLSHERSRSRQIQTSIGYIFYAIKGPAPIGPQVPLGSSQRKDRLPSPGNLCFAVDSTD